MTTTTWTPPVPLYEFLTQRILPEQLPIKVSPDAPYEVIHHFMEEICKKFDQPGTCWFIFDQSYTHFVYLYDYYENRSAFPYIWNRETNTSFKVEEQKTFLEWYVNAEMDAEDTGGFCIICREKDGPVQIKTIPLRQKGFLRRLIEHHALIREVSRCLWLSKCHNKDK